MAEKKTKGKQKIDMKKIESEEDRMTTFSKRRSGIYKKLNELILTCNAEVGFLVFSKTETPFTFAHPSIGAVYDRLMNPGRQHAKSGTESLVEAYKKGRTGLLNEGYEKLVEALEDERERRHMLEKMSEEKGIGKCWWKAPTERLGASEAQRMHDAFVELHDGLCDELFRRLHQTSEAISSSQQQPHE